MTPSDNDKHFVQEFFSAIAPLEQAYVHAAFHYVAVKTGDRFAILQGRVFLNTANPNLPTFHFGSSNVRAGRILLPELNLDIRSFVDRLMTGKLETPQGDLYFEKADGGRYAASFVPFHEDGLKMQSRFNVLTIMAGPKASLRQPDLDWEIKAATLPYDGLQELVNELNLGSIVGPTASVEIVAFNIAGIDLQKSRVSGTKANLQIMLAKAVKPDRASVGYRVYVPGTPTRRGMLAGDAIQWTEEEALRRGQAVLDVPNAAVLNCAVSYDGVAQTHQWIVDPEHVQNPRRAVYETFDPKLENLKAAINNASARGQDARQLEPAVAWLLWMLGFSVAHLSGPKSRDAADLLADTPSGHFAIVECTTGLLKAENKLALLHARAESVRRNLRESSNTVQRVLPVIVTTMTASQVKADMEAAEKLGIFVIAREALDQTIERTLIRPNADQLYTQAEQAVSAALTKYEMDPQLPFAANAASPANEFSLP